MERHEFDAAYARICEVCGMKTQTELSAYLASARVPSPTPSGA